MENNKIEDNLDEESYSLYSWKFVPPDITLKTMDKSAVLHGGTGIPAKFRAFFNIEDLQYGMKKPVELNFNNNRYQAYFSARKNNSTTLQWYDNFRSIIQKHFPNITKHFKNNEEKLGDYPLMEITKGPETDVFKIRFLGDDIEHSNYPISESIIFAKIGWSDNGWQGYDPESVDSAKSSGYSFVREHGIAFEWWNFYDYGDDYYYGWIQTRGNPSRFVNNGLVLFASINPVTKKYSFIGFYGSTEYGSFIPPKNAIDSINDINAREKNREQLTEILKPYWRAKKELSTSFYKLIEFELEEINQTLWGQASYMYVGEKDTIPKFKVQKLLERVINEHKALLDDDQRTGQQNIETVIDKTKKILSLYFSKEASHKNYWRIAPGRYGVLWDTWRDEKTCSIGYYEYKPYFKELLQISDKNSFNEKLVDIAKNNSGPVDFSFILSSQPFFHQNTIWSFYHEIKPGDIVIASTGKSRIYGIGTITSGVSTRDSEKYTHIRDVRWDYQDLNIPMPSEVTGNFTVTLNKLTSEDYNKIMTALKKKSQEADPDEEIETDPILNLLKRKGQVILYGPPGTGKTYHVQELINKKRSQIQKISTREYPNIFWTYFDQRNFSDFSQIDINSIYTYQWTEGWNYQIYFDKIVAGDILVCYGWNEHKIIGIAKCISKEEISFQYQFILLTDGPTYNTLRDDPIFSISKIIRTKANVRINMMDYPIFQQILTLAGQPADSIQIESYEKEEEINTTEFITFHQSFSYEEFIEGLRPTTEDGCISYSVKEGIFKEFCRRAYNTLLTGAGIKKTWEEEQDVPPLTDEETELVASISAKYPFYLVIDEINRGDISRIFGELITLLEKDKRLLAPHQITTKLPSSRTLFGIPPNLFVIGTMNTADKSIALIDVALRRRFGFIELLPDYELLARELVSDDRSVQEVFQTAISLLQTINIRILQEHDREHQIGHSFLLKLQGIEARNQAIYELSLIWYHEIIPLLHEYFYDSPKKLFKVIGPEFMKPDLKSITFTPMKEGESFLVGCAKVTKDTNFNAEFTTNAL